MKKVFFLIVFPVVFISCGPSAQEKEALKKMYSDSLDITKEGIVIYKELVEELKMELEVQNAKMNSIKDDPFFITEDQKAEQIREQRVRITEGEKILKETEQELLKLRLQGTKFENELDKYN